MRDSVSIVIPVRNGAAYLGEALASAFAQGPVVGEVIVIDDGSTDGTPAILDAVTDTRLRRIQPAPEGHGVSRARNAGLASASGRWVMFLDADDRLRDGAVAALLDAAAGSGCVAVYGDYDRIDATGHRAGRRSALLRRRGKPSGEVLARMARGNFIVNGGVMLIDRAVFSDLGGYAGHLALSEDWHAWCRLAARGPIVFAEDRHVLDYRVHPTSATTGKGLRPADYWPAVEAVFSDPEILARLGPADLGRTRRRAEAHIHAYCISQTLRTHRYVTAARALILALVAYPAEWPHLVTVFAGTLAGL